MTMGDFCIYPDYINQFYQVKEIELSDLMEEMSSVWSINQVNWENLCVVLSLQHSWQMGRIK
jgi:hypothetical protein